MSYQPYEFDPYKETGVKLESIPARERAAALRELAEYVRDQIVQKSLAGESSVEGGKWKQKLTKDYEQRKTAAGGAPFADLNNEGELLGGVFVRHVVSRNVLTIAVPKDKEGKADGNLTGSYGKSRPNYSQAREFMPHRRGQHLSDDIIEGMRKILESYGKED